MSQNELAPLISVLEARTARFEKQLAKATKTVDRQAGRQEQRWKKQYRNVDSRFKQMGKAMQKGLLIGTAAATALTAALTTGVVASLRYANELNNSALIAGVTAERFQEMTFASEKFGISQEKLSDILKDVQDRTSDYINTGGGPLLDFMEAAGTQAGLTADSFRGLASDEALGLIFKTLEDGGASQADFTFFLESLSGDAAKLIPLLRNGGRELNSFSKEARNVGFVLENDAVASAVDAQRALQTLSDTVSGNLRTAFIEAAPEIEELSETLIKLAPILAEWVKNTVEGIDKVAESFAKLNMSDADALAALPDAGTDLLEEDLKRHLKNREEAQKKYDEAVLRGQGSVIEKRKAQLDKYASHVEATEGKIADVRAKRIDEANREADELRDILENTSAAKPKAKATARNKGLSSNPKTDATAAILAAEIDAIRELGRTESEQIQELLAERLASIDKAKIAESEKATLRANVHADAQKELKEIADAEAEFKAQAMADIQAQADADFTANQDRLSFLAEIEATQARMAGRGIEATRIEMEAVRERYEAELAYIEQLIEAKGATPELEAERTNILAGLEENRAARVEFERITLEQIDAMTNNESRLENALAFIDRSEQAKLDRLADYYSQREDLEAEHQERVKEIEQEADEERMEARLQSYEDGLTSLQTALSGASQALRDAGLEDSKAGKAIAKAEQVTAIGQAIVNTGQGVTEALKLGPAGIPLAAAIGALGAVQVGVMAAQTFDGGGFTGNGTRTGGVDGKGGYYAIMHPNEVVADMTRPGREVNGQSLQSAFGFEVPQSNYKASQFSSLSQSSVSVGGASIVINGNADNEAITRMQAMLMEDRKNRAKEFNRMANARDKRLTSRQNRRVGIS